MSKQEPTDANSSGDEFAPEGADGPARSPHDEQACPCVRGPAAEGLEEFRSAFLSAVAMSWIDPAKLDLLRSEPRRFLRALCGYELPLNITLTVGDARGSHGPQRWQADWDALQEEWALPDAEITLYVPSPPTLVEQAVALAELGGGRRVSALICC